MKVPPVDIELLGVEVQKKYAEVALDPHGEHHFHTGRYAAERFGYPSEILDELPDSVVEAFAGVGNPFAWGLPGANEKVVDVGSGAGLDSVIAAKTVGPAGQVIGVDMTPDMLDRARRSAVELGLDQLEFREGRAERLPVDAEWADLVISNGVLNLIPDKAGAYRQIFRALRPGGRIQIADICVERPIPEGALSDIDLWTGWIAGALPCAGWQTVIEEAGFVDVEFGSMVDTFAGANAEEKARKYGSYGYAIRARKPA